MMHEDRLPGKARTVIEVIVVSLLALLFTIYFTYPLAPQMGSRLVDLADSKFSTYVHAWVAHALTTHPTQLWNMNFLFPAKNTLASSENWLGDQLLFAPVYLFTKNPVAAHNFVILGSFFLCAITMYIFIRWLTGDIWSSGIAAFIYAFAFPRLSALDHMQLLNTQWIPLVILCLFAYFQTKRLGRLVAMCIFLILQILCSLYLGYLAIIIAGCYFVGLLIANRGLITWKSLSGLAIAAIITGLLLFPIVQPYLQLEKQGTINIPLQNETTIKASASPIATYLEVKGWPNHPYAALLDRFNTTEYGWEKRFFMGFLAMVLALLGVLLLRKLGGAATNSTLAGDSSNLDDEHSGQISLWRAAVYGSVLTVIMAYLISLGPFLRINDRVTGIRLPFYFLRLVVPGFGAFRVPARFGFAVLFGLSVLAGFGFLNVVKWLARRSSRLQPYIGGSLMVLAFTFMSFEYRVAPYSLFPVMVPSSLAPEYQWLAKQPPRSAIVELPITGGPYFPDPWEQSAYLFASMYHWQPLINGYTSHRPELANSTYALALELPSSEAASVLQTLGVRYIVLHTNIMPEGQLQRWSAPHRGIVEVEDFGNAKIYRLDAPACTSNFGDITLTLETAQVAVPGDKFGFQILSDGLKRCWVDSNPGLRQLIAVWTNSSGRSEVAKTRISLPLYATAENPLNVLGFTNSPSAAGDYLFQIREIDHQEVKLPAQKVTLAEPPAANSITAPRQLSAEYRLTSSPTELKAGGKGRVKLSARNTGTAVWLSIWPPAKGSTGLGYRWIDSSGKEVSAGRLYLPYAVYPGVSYNYSGPIDAPEKPGEYTLYLGMVSELVTWFHDVGVAPIETHVVVRPSGDK